MRIGYIVKQYPRYSETFVVNEILAHERAGHNVEIFSLRPAMDSHFQDLLWQVRGQVHYVPDGAKASDFWAELSTALRDLPDAGEALRGSSLETAREVHQASWLATKAVQLGLEHLHAHFASTATSVARLTSRMVNIPYTFTAHAKDIFHDSVVSSQLSAKIRDAAAVITVSDFNLQYLRAAFPSESEQIHRVYNGLNLERFAFQPPRRRRPKIVGVGRLVEKKGFDVLIRAAQVLLRQGREFECEIIGTGEQEAQLRQLIADVGVQDYVVMAGPRPQNGVIEALRTAAVLAAPCIVGSDGNRDGLPTVLLEAMALGTPCVSTDVTGIPEIVIDGHTGLLASQNDPQELAVALDRLITSPSLRVRLATEARSRIERDFDVHRNAADLRRVFDNVDCADVLPLQEVG